MCNGSHRPAQSKGKQKRTESKERRKCGSALSAAPELKVVVTNLCSVKKIKIGAVTAKLDAIFVMNSTRADERRVTKKAEEMAAETRRMQKKGVKFNKNIEEPLAPTIGDLFAHLKAMDNAVGVSKDYLKRQFNARFMRAELDGFKYPSIGPEFRANTKKAKIKMTPSGNRNEVEYLQALVILMMKADARRGAVDNAPLQLSGLLRRVPTLNPQATNAKALKLRKQLEDEVCLEATQADDPWLIFLTEAYVGKICFLHDIAERHKLYRVSNIAYWPSTQKRYANWEATLEPIHLRPSGLFEVADEDTILGPSGARITKSKALIGYILAQYIDGDEEEPTRSDCVDDYIENAIEKLNAYLFKLKQLARVKVLKGMLPEFFIYLYPYVMYATNHFHYPP
jgi:hypothetical protein